jgi:hypothetical protein
VIIPDNTQLSPYLILKRKTVPKAKLPMWLEINYYMAHKINLEGGGDCYSYKLSGLNGRKFEKNEECLCWMHSKVFDNDARSVIHVVNTGLLVTSGGMTS